MSQMTGGKGSEKGTEHLLLEQLKSSPMLDLWLLIMICLSG